MPISFQAVEAGQNANRQNWHVKVHMKPNYNSKQKYQDCFSLGKGRFLSWGTSIASGHDLVLTTFFTEETWFYRSTKRFQNQASHATQFSAWLCKALLLLSSCTVWYYSTIVYIQSLDMDIFTWTKAIENRTIVCLPFSANIYNKKKDPVQPLLSNTHCT